MNAAVAAKKIIAGSFIAAPPTSLVCTMHVRLTIPIYMRTRASVKRATLGQGVGHRCPKVITALYNLQKKKRKKRASQCEIEGCAKPFHARFQNAQIPAAGSILDSVAPTQDVAFAVSLRKRHYCQMYNAYVSSNFARFSCGKLVHRADLIRPINAQCLNPENIDGAPLSRQERASARLCESCHTKEHKACDGTPSTDAALELMVQSLGDNCVNVFAYICEIFVYLYL